MQDSAAHQPCLGMASQSHIRMPNERSYTRRLRGKGLCKDSTIHFCPSFPHAPCATAESNVKLDLCL